MTTQETLGPLGFGFCREPVPILPGGVSRPHLLHYLSEEFLASRGSPPVFGVKRPTRLGPTGVQLLGLTRYDPKGISSYSQKRGETGTPLV